jgi:hypothetical protein
VISITPGKTTVGNAGNTNVPPTSVPCSTLLSVKVVNNSTVDFRFLRRILLAALPTNIKVNTVLPNGFSHPDPFTLRLTFAAPVITGVGDTYVFSDRFPANSFPTSSNICNVNGGGGGGGTDSTGPIPFTKYVRNFTVSTGSTCTVSPAPQSEDLSQSADPLPDTVWTGMIGYASMRMENGLYILSINLGGGDYHWEAPPDPSDGMPPESGWVLVGDCTTGSVSGGAGMSVVRV